jgi:polysaccharide biosynthesis/export protein
MSAPAFVWAQGLVDNPAARGGNNAGGATTQGPGTGVPGSGGPSLFPGSIDTAPTVITNRPRNGLGAGDVMPRRTDRGIGEQTDRFDAQQQERRQFPDIKEPRNEFQDFILQSTGRELPIFGSELFRNVPSTFAPVDDVPVTPDYIIGPGDEIVIRAWGQIDVDFSAIVDRNGTISVPKVGVFNVAGIKYQDLTSYLKTSFGRVFRNFELTATLGRLRSIQIFVVGQARRPGSYTVSSLSTMVNALFAVGGPSAKGSMRNIQLKRGNRVIAQLDLYELLLAGDKSKDAQLLPGDVIHIPAVGPLVAVTGSINVPAIYELNQKSSLSELVRWAGGLATTAQGQKVTLERIENRKSRKVDEFSLDSAGLARNVRDGDLVTVYALLPRFENVVTLRGNVAQPGRFPWRDGMRVRDLIPEKEALISRDYLVKRNQVVGLDQDMARILKRQDPTGPQLELADLLERKVKEAEDLTVGAAIRRKQIENDALRLVYPTLKFDSNQVPTPKPEQPRDPITDPLRLINQIKPPTAEVNWDYALIERLNPRDMSSSLLPFNLGKAILDGNPDHNLVLLPGDVVTVFSKEDIQVSAARQTKFIRLEGEFLSPGVYQIQPGETLRQLVVRIGGLPPNAYIFGSEFTRESTRKIQLTQYQEALNRLERDMEADAATRARTVISAEDAAALPALREARRAQIARLRELKPSGRIVLELPPQASLADLPEVPLEDGDRLYIPPPISMVSVYGSVFTETSFLYRPGKRVSDYISQAGGATVRADTGQIFILRADGSVAGSKRSWLSASLANAEVLRGDTIIVPEDYERVPLMRALRDWSQVFYQFGLGAAALKVLQN